MVVLSECLALGRRHSFNSKLLVLSQSCFQVLCCSCQGAGLPRKRRELLVASHAEAVRTARLRRLGGESCPEHGAGRPATWTTTESRRSCAGGGGLLALNIKLVKAT